MAIRLLYLPSTTPYAQRQICEATSSWCGSLRYARSYDCSGMSLVSDCVTIYSMLLLLPFARLIQR